jgi:hypothetical protein
VEEATMTKHSPEQFITKFLTGVEYNEDAKKRKSGDD